MKKLLFMAILLTGFGFTGMAQDKAKKTAETKVSTASTLTKADQAKTKTVSSGAKATAATTPGAPLKAEGTPDKRYKVNKAVAKHVKKDGTPDKRFKENKAKP